MRFASCILLVIITMHASGATQIRGASATSKRRMPAEVGARELESGSNNFKKHTDFADKFSQETDGKKEEDAEVEEVDPSAEGEDESSEEDEVEDESLVKTKNPKRLDSFASNGGSEALEETYDKEDDQQPVEGDSDSDSEDASASVPEAREDEDKVIPDDYKPATAYLKKGDKKTGPFAKSSSSSSKKGGKKEKKTPQEDSKEDKKMSKYDTLPKGVKLRQRNL
jgi:hypothetical protein